MGLYDASGDNPKMFCCRWAMPLLQLLKMTNLAAGKSESKRWEGFNHVACIIIASAMAGIGLITDSLSVVEGDAMIWVIGDHPQDVFFGGEFWNDHSK